MTDSFHSANAEAGSVQASLAQAVLDLNASWNHKDHENVIAGHLDLCRRLALLASSDPVELSQRITELCEQHGSLRAAARVLDVDPGYLSRLDSGESKNPGDKLLRRMGLRAVTTYERTK